MAYLRENLPAVWMGLAGVVGSIASAALATLVVVAVSSAIGGGLLELGGLPAVAMGAATVVFAAVLLLARGVSLGEASLSLMLTGICSSVTVLALMGAGNRWPILPPDTGLEGPIAIAYSLAAVPVAGRMGKVWAVVAALAAFWAALGAFWFTYYVHTVLRWAWFVLPGFGVGLVVGLTLEAADWMRSRRPET